VWAHGDGKIANSRPFSPLRADLFINTQVGQFRTCLYCPPKYDLRYVDAAISSGEGAKMKKAAVILCGSGFKDGSEVRESVGVLWALSEENVNAAFFAPDEEQADVVNCLTGEVAQEKRNQRVEAARIARGEVKPLGQLSAADFDMLLIPGGFGAAKNLCSFAKEGSGGKVHSGMQRVLEEFQSKGKPIGAVCIAPAILALAFRGKQLELTVGDTSEASAELEKLGHRHLAKKASEWVTDAKNRVVTTPAYMHDQAPLHEIFTGIRGMVREVCKLA
jgi:enhancing lycopene biosynthesis protein 2